MMTDFEIICLVQQMRNAQKAYYRNRTHDRLIQSKELEANVDKVLFTRICMESETKALKA